MWSRTYVCCAVPLYNSGIYAILAQFVVVSLVTAILTFASPNIIAVSLPNFAPILLGLVCLAITFVQGLGFFGIFKERPKLFKTYARINAALVSIALIMALIYIIVSASRHTTTLATCEALFASQTQRNSTIGGTSTALATGSVTSGSAICNIWMWVQVGIMGLLFIIVLLVEGYFLMYQRIYSSEQKLDHARYNSVYSTAAEEIRQSGIWEQGRRSGEDLPASNAYTSSSHLRSASGLRNEIRDDSFPDLQDRKREGYGYTPPAPTQYEPSRPFTPSENSPKGNYAQPNYSHEAYGNSGPGQSPYGQAGSRQPRQHPDPQGGQQWDPAYR